MKNEYNLLRNQPYYEGTPLYEHDLMSSKDVLDISMVKAFDEKDPLILAMQARGLDQKLRDFWQTILDQNVSIVVSLNQEF